MKFYKKLDLHNFHVFLLLRLIKPFFEKNSKKWDFFRFLKRYEWRQLLHYVTFHTEWFPLVYDEVKTTDEDLRWIRVKSKVFFLLLNLNPGNGIRTVLS